MSNAQAQAVGLLTQKDLAEELGVTSLRQVQRIRHRFNLEPVAFTGINPVFDPVEVARVKAERIAALSALNKKRRGQKTVGGILTLKQIRAKAKRTKAEKTTSKKAAAKKASAAFNRNVFKAGYSSFNQGSAAA
jgi:hypothetical protein